MAGWVWAGLRDPYLNFLFIKTLDAHREAQTGKANTKEAEGAKATETIKATAILHKLHMASNDCTCRLCPSQEARPDSHELVNNTARSHRVAQAPLMVKANMAAKAKPNPKSKAKSSKEDKGKTRTKAKAKADNPGKAKANKVVAMQEAKEEEDRPDESEEDKKNRKRGEAKGWDEIEEGKGTLSKRASMAVLARCSTLAKNGNPGPLETYRNLPRGQAKFDFALALKMDRSAAFLLAKEVDSTSQSSKRKWVSGWLTEDQIAQKEGLVNYESSERQQETLKTILEDLPCRPHDRPALAAKGIKLYEYSKQVDECAQERKHKVAVEAWQEMDKAENYNAIAASMDKECQQIAGTSRSHTQTKALKSTPVKELTENQKSKAEWIKEARVIQSTLARESATFVQLKVKANHLQHDKMSGVTKQLLGCIEAAGKELKKYHDLVVEIVFDAQDMDPDHFKPSKAQVQKAKDAINKHQDLKAKALRIVGK